MVSNVDEDEIKESLAEGKPQIISKSSRNKIHKNKQ